MNVSTINSVNASIINFGRKLLVGNIPEYKIRRKMRIIRFCIGLDNRPFVWVSIVHPEIGGEREIRDEKNDAILFKK